MLMMWTDLSEEHRQDGQADPVDDAGKLECIIDCGERKQRTKSLVFLLK